ncbi:VWA domain-containing protein [Candidatus Aminicenantes bacterium AC-335-A11]|jgi:VWFA-related protein|nr:VWA domain-containing protein [SCandidatus Aminicenantes bacterium Aminicenantia_JdfR_composite]MCP2597130.1 VWA domain-containing protein [Candidatus Aminicenantes bacterium AC-335-G13]MCP2606459.1 VWA domain-containing protein [Candidatus Aminicenantes bacterium AC-708-I09]MCP2618609.1 VWA domain-containing protein [Candidatus Aminicenantes bacterium AC-335-A11]
MKKKFLISIIILVNCLLSLYLSAQTKESPLKYEVKVVVVDVPVYVTDKQGNPVLDLTPDDFILLEDGKEQKITHFTLVINDSPKIRTILREYPSARRHFFLLFDLSFASLKGILKAREVAINFIKDKIQSTDLVAIGTYSIFSGLKIIVPFTNDKDQLLIALDTFGMTKKSKLIKGPAGFLFKPYQEYPEFERTREPQVGTTLQEEVIDQIEDLLLEMRKFNKETYKSYIYNFIDSLKTLAQALNIISGRKHLIYFSEGFDSELLVGKSIRDIDKNFEALLKRQIWKIDTELAGSPTLRMNLFEALQYFVNSDCTIHTIDIGGLRGGSQVSTVRGTSLRPSTIRAGQDTLNLLARETGGKAFRNINDLEKPLEDILKLTNAYYLLGYYPKHTEKKGEFRKIEVKVKRPGLQVSYRKGYYTKKPFKKYSEFEKKLQLVEYISKDIFSNDIEFQILSTVYYGTSNIAKIPVFIKIPGKQFFYENNKTKELKLEIYGYALNRSREFVDFFHQKFGINLKKLGKRLENSGIKYYDLLLVYPGDVYKLKIIIRNSENGKVGCKIQNVYVPNYDTSRLIVGKPVIITQEKDWILIRGYNPKRPSGRKALKGLPISYPFVFDKKEFIPGVLPVIKKSSINYVFFKVFNLKTHPEAKIPQTQMKFEVIDDSGHTIPVTKIDFVDKPKYEKPNAYKILLKFKLENLEPGEYHLKVTVIDLLTNQLASAITPFIIQ